MKKIIIILLTLLGITNHIYSAFEDYGWGTRAAALGGAYIAVADDSSAPFYNPAGISLMEKSEASFMYAGLLTGLDMETLSMMRSGVVLKPYSFGSIGANWARFNVNGLYTEDIIILTYANNLNQIHSSINNNILIGANIKIFRSKFILYDDEIRDDPVFSQGDSKMSFGIDLGCIVKINNSKIANDTYKVGLSILNINQPNIGLEQRDIIPMQVKGGFYYPINIYGTFLEKISINRSLIAVSITYIDKNDINVHIGLENNFLNDLLSFRLGGNLREIGGGLGFKYGLKNYVDIILNYVFLYPFEIRDTYGSHRTSLSVRF